MTYPFTYLYNFTAATCWLDLTERYSVIGAFSLGKKSDVAEAADASDNLASVLRYIDQVFERHLFSISEPLLWRTQKRSRTRGYACTV